MVRRETDARLELLEVWLRDPEYRESFRTWLAEHYEIHKDLEVFFYGVDLLDRIEGEISYARKY